MRAKKLLEGFVEHTRDDACGALESVHEGGLDVGEVQLGVDHRRRHIPWARAV